MVMKFEEIEIEIYLILGESGCKGKRIKTKFEKLVGLPRKIKSDQD